MNWSLKEDLKRANWLIYWCGAGKTKTMLQWLSIKNFQK